MTSEARRAQWRNYYHSHAEARNYRRSLRRRRKRIAEKRALLEQLESHAQENA